MVEAPYDVLKNVEIRENGMACCTVENEFIYESEGGPMGCSEFGRHLAILGEYSLANHAKINQKQYYLAANAKLQRLNTEMYSAKSLHLSAKVQEISKRSARIIGELNDNKGNTLFTGIIEYHIVTAVSFERIFAQHQSKTEVTGGISPYIKRKGLFNYKTEGMIVSGDYGIVEAKDCAGHFSNHPALPAAIVGGLMGNLGMQMHNQYFPEFDKIVGKYIEINARRLAFSGEYLTFKGEISEIIGENTIRMHASAKVGEEIVADAEFLLEGVNAHDVVGISNEIKSYL